MHFVLRGFESHRPNSNPGRQATFRDFAIHSRPYNPTLFMVIRKINTDSEYFYNGEVVKFNMADYLGLDHNGEGVLMKIHLAAPPKKDGCCGERVHCLVRMCDLEEFKNECPNRYVVVLLIDEPVFSYTPPAGEIHKGTFVPVGPYDDDRVPDKFPAFFICNLSEETPLRSMWEFLGAG